jgi:hypothetical protein
MTMPKIFCIGLPKTGTTSLHHAAEILGLRSIHWPHDQITVRQLRAGDYDLKIMKTCDIVSDIPISAIFPQLDRHFPGAKFVMTHRDRAAWLESQRKAPFNNRLPTPGGHRDFYRAMLYGVTEFSEERFSWVYDEHVARVQRYFSGDRMRDLLQIDITAGDSWRPLCDFLGLPIPDEPFPHSNKALVDHQPSIGRRVMERLLDL